MKKMIVIGAAFALVGCTTGPAMQWVKPGSTQSEFQRDNLTCRQYGMQSAMANGLAGNMFVETWIQRETGVCLRNLGYYQQSANQIQENNRKMLFEPVPAAEEAVEAKEFEKPNYSIFDRKKKTP